MRLEKKIKALQTLVSFFRGVLFLDAGICFSSVCTNGETINELSPCVSLQIIALVLKWSACNQINNIAMETAIMYIIIGGVEIGMEGRR